jgi:ABC-type Fe3+ transport system permease subunit
VNTQIIPLAITMMAGPQIMTAIVLVTHPTPVKVSIPFLVGVAVAATLGTTIYFLIGGAIDLGDPSDNGSTGHIIQYVLVGLLVFLATRTYRHREKIEPPKWLGGLLEASPRKALAMGFVLIFLMPTDIASMATVGVNLQHNGDSLLDAVPFLALTVLIAALPLLGYLLLGRRAKEAMPKVRDWMSANSWLVNIIVLGIFVVLIVG